MQNSRLYFKEDVRIYYDTDKVIIYTWNDSLPVKIINKRAALLFYIMMKYPVEKSNVYFKKFGYIGNVNSFIKEYNNILTYNNTSIMLDIKRIKEIQDKDMNEINYRSSYPLHVQWIATFKCSHNCVYCGVKKQSPKKNELKIPFENIKHRLEEAVKEGTRIFSIHGGDSLFEYGNDIFILIKELVDRECDVILSTKSLFSVEKAKLLQKTGLKYIQLSVDTNNSIVEKSLYGKSGYYSNFLLSTERLASVGIKVSVNIVITRLNRNNIIELIKELSKLENVYSIVLSWYEKTVNNTSDLELNAEEKEELIGEIGVLCESDDLTGKVIYGLAPEEISIYEKPVCANGRYKFMIFPDGSCGVCDFIDDARYKAGNVCGQSIKAVWNSNKYQDLVYIRHNDTDNKCKSCKYYFECIKRGRCFNKMLIKNNGEYGPDFICKECY